MMFVTLSHPRSRLLVLLTKNRSKSMFGFQAFGAYKYIMLLLCESYTIQIKTFFLYAVAPLHTYTLYNALYY